jgi:hypothetical protein
MLVLNRLLLNRGYVVINAPKALASIISMCHLHVIFLSNITLRYFTLFPNGIFRPFYEAPKFKFLVYYDRRSVGQSVLVLGTPFGTATNISSSLDLFLDSFWFNDVGRFL